MVTDSRITDPGRGGARRLQKRTRPSAVTRELEELARLPRGLVLQRVRATGHGKGPSREALVSLARTFHGEDDTEAVQAVLEALIARVSGALRRKLHGWHVPAADREDLQRHLITGLCGYWLSTAPGEELWECNFTTPFELRALTLIQGFFPKTVRPSSLQSLCDDGEEAGAERDIADPQSEAPFRDLLRNVPERAALKALAEEHPLWSRALHDKFVAGHTEGEIAARLGVTSRTVRNWVSAARRFLRTRIEKEGA